MSSTQGKFYFSQYNYNMKHKEYKPSQYYSTIIIQVLIASIKFSKRTEHIPQSKRKS